MEFEQGGARIFRRCPPGVTKAQAEQFERAIRRDLFDRDALGKQPPLEIAAALQSRLEAVLPHRKDKRMLKANSLAWADYIKGKGCHEAPEVAESAIKAWAAEGLGPGTINRRLAALKSAINHAWRTGRLDVSLAGRIQKLREPPGRQVYLSAAQVRKLAAAAPDPRYKAAVMLLAYTGMRVGELLAVKERPTGNAIVVKDSKPGEGRVVPVAAPAKRFLKALPLDVAYRTLFEFHEEARVAAGMPTVRLHDLRHTTASMLAAKGVGLPVIGALLGHKAAATTKRYTHLADRTVRAAVAKLR